MININKVKRTKGGNEVVQVFHFPENPTNHKIIALVRNHDGHVVSNIYDENGKIIFHNHFMDLIEEPEKTEQLEARIKELESEMKTYKDHIKRLHMVANREGDTYSALKSAIAQCPKHYYVNNPPFSLKDRNQGCE